MKKIIKKLTAVALAIVISTSLFTSAFAVLRGDVILDSKVNSMDALYILRYSVGLETEIDKKVADVNCDGQINSLDALGVLRISVGIDKGGEVEEDEEISAPSSAAEIVEMYNNAINKVVNDKAGYTKQRTTTIQEMNGGALLKIQLVKDMINEFLGVGTTEFTNHKGSSKHLLTASLTSEDIKSAHCEKTGQNYTVTLNLKDGSSSANAVSKKDSSALARCGLVTGKVADPQYDYLSSGCVYESISDVKDVSVKSIKAANTNVKIVAVIDEQGKLISLTASYDWTVEMESIKYTVVSVKQADGKAHTAVVVSDFKW